MNTLFPPYLIRPIRRQDNAGLRAAIAECLADYGDIGKNYLESTPVFNAMYETYAHPRSRYWVVENVETGEILGGGGYIPFPHKSPAHVNAEICEFQKFYFHSALRGKGMGKALLAVAAETARNDGFDVVYLETIERMAGAIALYKKTGFIELPEPWGKTFDETPCEVFMALPLIPELNILAPSESNALQQAIA